MSDETEAPKLEHYGPTDGWSDAKLLEITRDTRAWFTHDDEGHVIGDWEDTRAHLPTLYAIARSVCWPNPTHKQPLYPPRMLEIGVRHGVASLALLQACKETGGHLTSLEICEEFATVARERVEAAGLSPWWDLQLVNSNAYSSGPLDLLWIDGDHSYAQCKLDVENHAPRVRSGGYVLMHDAWNVLEPGVPVVIDEMRATGKYEICVLQFSYGLAICRVL
jgi:hypothetical protein